MADILDQIDDWYHDVATPITPKPFPEQHRDELYLTYVYTWGKPSLIGHNTKEKFPRILIEFEMRQVIAVRCASYFSLALTASGQVWCWGQARGNPNGNPYSWYDEPEGEGYPATPARLLGDLFDIFAVDVACSTPGGNGAYCGVVADDGKAYWWDNVDNGESEVTDPTVRLIDGVNGRVTQLAFGERIGAVLTEKGEVYTLDLRGDGETNLVTGLLSSRRVVQIACGSTYYCALTDTHDLYTWGRHNEHSNGGFLGHGTKYPTADLDDTPRLVEALAGNCRYVSTGWIHTQAVDLDGKLYTWGDGHTNRLGHLGPEDGWGGTPRHAPCPVEAVADRDVVQVSGSRGNEACLTSDRDGNEVFVWGGPRFGGQFNYQVPTPLNNWQPIYRNGQAHIKQVACGRFHTVLITQVPMTLLEICLRFLAYNRELFTIEDIESIPSELQFLLERFMRDRRIEPFSREGATLDDLYESSDDEDPFGRRRHRHGFGDGDDDDDDDDDGLVVDPRFGPGLIAQLAWLRAQGIEYYIVDDDDELYDDDDGDYDDNDPDYLPGNEYPGDDGNNPVFYYGNDVGDHDDNGDADGSGGEGANDSNEPPESAAAEAGPADASAAVAAVAAVSPGGGASDGDGDSGDSQEAPSA